MGYTTDFIGHIDVTPPLNSVEQDYLSAFSTSRRWCRPTGPYVVPRNPQAERVEGRGDADIDAYNTPPPGQPGLWCEWVACWDGCCLSFTGHEKFYDPVPWLTYLIEHFLAPGAKARGAHDADPAFDQFTFDHHCDGLIVGCRRNDKELFAIRVEDNVVTTEILRTRDERYVDRPPLPYEAYADKEQEWLEESRHPQPRSETIWSVVDPR